MFGMLLLFSVFALSTIGGVAIARAGVDSEHATGSTVGVLACVLSIVVATIAMTTSGLLQGA